MSLELRLERQPSTDAATLGRLYVDDVFECWVLEDVWREGPKIAHETAIPFGRFAVTITYSPRFRCMLPLVVDVPGFEGIRIHAGNSAIDTSGCLLVGRDRVSASTIGRSRVALEALQAKIAPAVARGIPVWLTIVPALAPALTV